MELRENGDSPSLGIPIAGRKDTSHRRQEDKQRHKPDELRDM